MKPVSVQRKNLWAAITLLTLVLFSCEPEPLRIIPAGTIVPLKVGNEWGYSVRIYDQSGALTDSSYDTVKVIQEVVIDNELWFIDNDGNIQTNRTDGRWVRSEVAYLVEKFPSRLNEMYRLIDSVTIVRVRGVDETVSIPTGRYLSYIYQWMRNGFLVGDFYYAPNVGMIKSEKYMQQGSGVFLIERKELLWVSLKQ